MYTIPQQSYLPPIRQPAKPQPTKPQSNTMLIVFVAGLFILVGGVAVIYFIEKGKNSSDGNIVKNGDFSEGSKYWSTPKASDNGVWSVQNQTITTNGGSAIFFQIPNFTDYAGKTVRLEYEIVSHNNGSIYAATGKSLEGAKTEEVKNIDIPTGQRKLISTQLKLDDNDPELGFVSTNFSGSLDNVKAFVVS